MLIDSHCHLTDKKFAGEIDGVIERARDAGVEMLICLTSSLKDALAVDKLVKKYDCVFGLVGVHPENAHKWLMNTNEHQLKNLIINNRKIVGIGEIGMDKYWNERDIDKQEKVFRAQLELALELDKPVAIHNRLAETEMRRVLDSYKKLPAGVMHCFSGNEDWLKYVLEKGFYVSFAGNVTYPGKRFTPEESDVSPRSTLPPSGEKFTHLQYLAKKAPLERLLVETDAPYLPPEGKRGQKNESANVRITAEFLANLRGEGFDELEIQTTKNAKRLFKI